MNILYVDDEPFILEDFEDLFSDAASIFVASSVDQALKVIEEHGPFEMVISDYRMPHRTGEHLLKALKTGFPGTIRCLCSSYKPDEVSSDLYDHFLCKPWDYHYMRKLISDLAQPEV